MKKNAFEEIKHIQMMLLEDRNSSYKNEYKIRNKNTPKGEKLVGIFERFQYGVAVRAVMIEFAFNEIEAVGFFMYLRKIGHFSQFKLKEFTADFQNF